MSEKRCSGPNLLISAVTDNFFLSFTFKATKPPYLIVRRVPLGDTGLARGDTGVTIRVTGMARGDTGVADTVCCGGPNRDFNIYDFNLSDNYH